MGIISGTAARKHGCLFSVSVAKAVKEFTVELEEGGVEEVVGILRGCWKRKEKEEKRKHRWVHFCELLKNRKRWHHEHARLYIIIKI